MTEIRGHGEAISAFMTAMRGERPHHGWLFAGPEGLGKATLAFQAARRLLAEASDTEIEGDGLHVPEGHTTSALMAAWSHPDFILIDRLPKDTKIAEKPRAEWEAGVELRRSIRVDQIRELHHRFVTKPTFSSRRIVIIDGAEYCELSASNALLKMLEEPPTGTVFILITHSPGRLLPTIRSRCRLLRFSGLPDDIMTSILGVELPEMNATEVKALVAQGQGSPGRAIKLAGLDVAGLTKTLEQLAQSGDCDNAIRAKLSQSLSVKSAQSRFEAFLGLVPAFLASEARKCHGVALKDALYRWEAARDLAQHAIPGSLDPHSVTFALAGHVAALAPAMD